MEHSKVICDLTNPYASEEELDKQINFIKTLPLKGVEISPFWAKKVVRDLNKTTLTIQANAGNLDGNQLSQTKIFATQQLQKIGVNEIISTLNIAALRTNKEWCKLEALTISETAHKNECLHILRLPNCDLTPAEINFITHLCYQTGIDTLYIQERHLSYYQLIKKSLSQTIELQIKSCSINLYEKELKNNFDTVILSYDLLSL